MKLGFLFRMRFFPVYLAAIQRNKYKLTSEAECKDWVDWSEQQEVDTGSG